MTATTAADNEAKWRTDVLKRLEAIEGETKKKAAPKDWFKRTTDIVQLIFIILASC